MKAEAEKMNTKKLSIAFSIIAMLTLVSTFSGCTESEEEPEITLDTGDEFTFITLDNTEQQLSDYRGKIVVLDMWATWCQPCQYQMLELKKAYDYYDSDDLQILSIDIDSRETISLIQQFKDEFAKYDYDLEWTFGLVKDNLDDYMPEGAIPTLAIFDQQGNLAFRHSGISYFEEIPTNYPADQPQPPLLKEQIDSLL
jgi:thiol-disulfide isomerase/thioredoxin